MVKLSSSFASKKIMLLFFAGFVLSLLGSLPPGLISLTVSRVSVVEGWSAALAISMGAALAEFFQALAAVSFSDWFLDHPEALQVFQWAAAPLFLGLGLYLIFFAKTPASNPQNKPKHQGSFFVKGLAVSTFNLLAVPYWFAYCGWLKLSGWWREGIFNTLVFSLGVSVGTLFALGLYAWLGQWALSRSGQVAKYANATVGVIFLLLGAKILIGLLT